MMDYEYVMGGPYGTNRLWLYGMPGPFLKGILDTLCCWGGADKQSNDYVSWELPKYINRETMDLIMRRNGCTAKER